MPDLFSEPSAEPAPPAGSAPLAQRMRPVSLDEYAGQEHILAPGKLLRRAIEADRISSIILFGPPGTGKTTLAEIIASATQSRFERLSGVESNVADLRRVIASAANRLANKGGKTILFIDEIHRWNKAQQDVLLPDVERGTVRLIGATTHNPYFYINSPLVSRSQVFQLEPLRVESLVALQKRAVADEARGFGKMKIEMTEEALAHLATAADGDARKCLNALEIAVVTTPPDADGVIRIDRATAEESIQKKAVVYDADGDQHYDTISAFIKSVRGSDPDAALYWLAKMLYAGEEVRFLARRLVILASEDIGLADPHALVLAVAEMPRHRERRPVFHIRLRGTQRGVGAVRFRRSRQIHRAVRQRNLRLRQPDEFHRLLRRHRQHQPMRIGQPDVLARQNHQPPRDEPHLLAGVEHFRQPVERRVRVGAAHAFYKCGDRVVVLIAIRVIDHRFFLDAFLRRRAVDADHAIRTRRRRHDRDFQRVQTFPRIAIRRRGEMRERLLRHLDFHFAKAPHRIRHRALLQRDQAFHAQRLELENLRARD